MKQPDGLIAVLLDRGADPGNDRSDAAMDLSRFDEPEALDALIAVASDASEPESLLDDCGDSIGEIWWRQGVFDASVFARLAPVAQKLVQAWAAKAVPPPAPPTGIKSRP